MKFKEFYNSIDINDNDFKELISKSKSFAQVMRSLNINADKYGYRFIHKKIDELKLDTSHMTGRAWNQGERFKKFSKDKWTFDEIFCKDSKTRMGTSDLKYKLFKLGLKEQKCYSCGLTDTWNGKPLVLQLHHINGDRKDNRLENLQILCPNCHSQTHNYCGKNKKNNNVVMIRCPFCNKEVNIKSNHIDRCHNKYVDTIAKRDSMIDEFIKDCESGKPTKIGQERRKKLSSNELLRRDNLVLNSGIEFKFGCVGKISEKTGMTWKQVKDTLKRLNIKLKNIN